MQGFRLIARARLIAVVGAAFAFVLATGAQGFAQDRKRDDFQTAAPFAILVEAESGTVLFEKSADQLMHPSSMAKLMTAEVVFNALRQGQVKLEDEISISENAWRKGGAPSGGSTMYAQLNSRVKIDDLLHGIIIQSANDGCIAMAEGLAGNEANFATLMTKRARELGLTKSRFTNSTGLPDPDLLVTARELSMLARHLIREYPEFYKLYSEREFTWNRIRQQNRNPLLAMGIGADGLKTGYTKEAGYGLVGSAVQNGLRLIVVVNGLKTAKDRADEARKLIDWGFRAFESRLLFAEGEAVGEAKVFGGEQGRVSLTGNGPIRLLVPRGSQEKLLAKIVYTGPVAAPVTKGTRVGVLRVWRGDRQTLEAPLFAAEDVGTGGLTQRAFDAATEWVIGLFKAGAERI